MGFMNGFCKITGVFLRMALSMALLISLSACMAGQGKNPMRFKQITPELEDKMSFYIEKGCDREYRYFDPQIAQLYSIIPGGGQFYIGENRKGWMYALSFPLIIPYIISFQDAQNSVDYYNLKYTLKQCREMFGPNKKPKAQKRKMRSKVKKSRRKQKK